MILSVAISLNPSEGEPILLKGDLCESIASASSIGYTGVEIHLRDIQEINISQIKECCLAHNIKVSALATGQAKRIDGLSLIDNDFAARKRAVERVMCFIDGASQLNAGVIVGSMRGNLPLVGGTQSYERLLDSFREISNYSSSKGTNIYIEAINRYENNYLNRGEEIVKLIDLLESPFIKVHLDTFHMNIEEPNMCEAIEKAGEKLGYIHFADNTRGAVGSGSIDFRSVLDSLQKIGYDETISIECLPIPTGTAAAKQSIEEIFRLRKDSQSA